eukprot:13445952-Heterocapsa_arctica.AAC.1
MVTSRQGLCRHTRRGTTPRMHSRPLLPTIPGAGPGTVTRSFSQTKARLSSAFLTIGYAQSWRHGTSPSGSGELS